MAARRLSWRDVRDRIHAQILAGRYEPGDKLPRDADIAEELNCARATVQRAMQDLSDSGLIERRRKGGTHVRRDPVARATLDIPLTRREIEEAGGTYGYRLLSRAQRAAPRAIRQRMGLPEAARLLRIEALHLSDGRPYLVEVRWVNPEVAPEILEVDLDVISANEWLVLNKPYTRFGLEITAEAADARTAGHLGIGDGTAILVVERTTWIDDSPITSVRAMMAPGYRLLAET